MCVCTSITVHTYIYYTQVITTYCTYARYVEIARQCELERLALCMRSHGTQAEEQSKKPATLQTSAPLEPDEKSALPCYVCTTLLCLHFLVMSELPALPMCHNERTHHLDSIYVEYVNP